MRSGPLFKGGEHAPWSRDDGSPLLSQFTTVADEQEDDGDQTPRPGDATPTLGNTPPEPPHPRILSHKQRRKEKRKASTVGTTI